MYGEDHSTSTHPAWTSLSHQHVTPDSGIKVTSICLIALMRFVLRLGHRGLPKGHKPRGSGDTSLADGTLQYLFVCFCFFIVVMTVYLEVYKLARGRRGYSACVAAPNSAAYRWHIM